MQEADYSDSIFATRIHPVSSSIGKKLMQVQYTVVSLRELLRKSYPPQHPYCVVLSDIDKHLNRVVEAVRGYGEEPALPTKEAERKRFIKQVRDQFFLDVLNLEFTAHEIAAATSVSIEYLEKLRPKSN
ncbi:MAG: Hypothetical protein BHV28_09450 [Candidatus Tokpelaia hoelldobleri]|uniref:Uncharacterized protein n=1 Tax=Candidatus Tokpelaia hoelldobleri TaxID=1902579 RepID=A0A1U9JUW8_9HYPH|nr:MAG: Hypothetical protein BHV28_09450 [Candidatus Tokpelaia hoelldoblerii]